MDDTAILTVGLVIFAGAQVWLQVRTEQNRVKERLTDQNEAADRAFHFVWAEHFRIDALAKRLENSNLVELTVLGVLRPDDVISRDTAQLTESLSALGREAGFLGGVAGTLAFDAARQIATYVGSVRSFAEESSQKTDAQRVVWIQENYSKALQSWEASIRKSVRELSLLLWDAASHSPRASVARALQFSDAMTSEVGAAAAKALLSRAESKPK